MRCASALALVLILTAIPGAGPSPADEPARALYIGAEPPAGVTVLDRHRDRWLLGGEATELTAIPGAKLLGEPAAAPPARTFTPTPTPLIDDLVAQVDGAALIADVEWLVSLGLRNSTSPNIRVVADSLQARLDGSGLQTEKHWFGMGSGGSIQVPNVVATKTGAIEPDSVFVVCAHYDATSEDPFHDTPGADDNGSGTIAVLTAARLLAPLELDYTVKFVLFAGEERGLVGSEAWCADMAAEGLPILGALNFDMVGWWTEGVPFDLEIETNNASRWMADAICWAAGTYTGMNYQLHVADYAYWGDFFSFWNFGFCAVNHEESWDWGDPDFNPYYHSTEDTPDKLSAAFFEGCTRIAVAATATLAGVASGPSAVPASPAGGSALSAGPNPFNGRVVLSLAAAGIEGARAVSIYDLRGRRVDGITVVLDNGIGRTEWDARDRSGRALPGGVYVARAEALPGRPACRMTYVP